MNDRINLWRSIILLVVLVIVLAFPHWGQELRDLRGDRLSRRSNLSGILQNQEPAFLAVEKYLREDALSRNGDSADFSEWYYPVLENHISNQITGLTRFDGSTLRTKPILDALQTLWKKYDQFTSICIMPARTIFSFDSGLSNLVYTQEAVKPTYLLSPDEPLEVSVTRISDFWYRVQVSDVTEE